MSKRNKIIYWIATLWLALGMVSTGIVQVFKVAQEKDYMTQLGYPSYFLTIIGIWKFLGVIAILLPKFPVVKEWAYAGFFFTMTGAIISHIVVGDGMGDIFPAILLLALTALSYFFRPTDRKINSIHA
ncbi:DoxX-like protein [Chitinophaga skermanii]|uniref:DoxX-like protein n=1 Tax=Chitinophaga skermanii TaxID=331697 RepID=A0A327QWF1_9BACT|nr:DoxX family protein [Chitinophaga skermanii]RAJ08661.1 DoxX-like protein [Chitinophaga skermanii]